MLLSKKFLQLKEKIEVLETFIKQEKQELEKKLTEKFEALEALKNEEVDVKLQLIDEMDKSNIKTQEVEDKLITRQQKLTLKIEDEQILTKEIITKNKVFLKLLEDKSIKTKNNLIEFLMPRKFENKNVLELASRYQQVEGQLLKGIAEHRTDYLTVRSKGEK